MGKEKNIFPSFSCFPGRLYRRYYFHYVYLWDYKKPPLRLRHSSTQNQLNATHKHKLIKEQHLKILEQPVPEEPIIDEQKLRFIVSHISIWDYFGIPQANYLALFGIKSRMFNDYYKNFCGNFYYFYYF